MKEEYEGQLECLEENTDKYIFSANKNEMRTLRLYHSTKWNENSLIVLDLWQALCDTLSTFKYI